MTDQRRRQLLLTCAIVPLVALAGCTPEKRTETLPTLGSNAKDAGELAPRERTIQSASKRCRPTASSASALNVSECEALVFVLDALGGAALIEDNVEPCDWRPVSCYEREGAIHVVETNLHSSNLSVELRGELPARIEELAHLEELMLSGHNVRWPTGGLKLPSLRRLNLAGTGQVDFPAGLETSQLVSLNLAYNKISTVPASVVDLKSLEALQLPNKDLFLSDNPLTELPSEIGDLASLTELEVKGTKLDSLPPEIGKLSSLKGLYAQGAGPLGATLSR